MRENIFERLAFIGASTTSGQGMPLRFDQVFLELLAPQVYRESEVYANNRFGLLPQRIGQRMVTWAKEERRARFVVAVDFLFWFAHGSHTDRMASLEEGFRLLEQLDCLIAVGTIPAVPMASKDLLPLHLRPTEDELMEINRRIAAWVAAHPARVLIPWAETAARYPEFRQEDGLHTTIPGLRALAMALKGALIAQGLAASGAFATVP